MEDLKITMSVADLLAELRKNLEQHEKMYAEALENFVQEARAIFKRRMEQIEQGELAQLSVSLHKPENHARDYRTAISMLERTKDETIVLDATQYRCFVEDEWGWLRGWLASNARYSQSISAYNASKFKDD